MTSEAARVAARVAKLMAGDAFGDALAAYSARFDTTPGTWGLPDNFQARLAPLLLEAVARGRSLSDAEVFAAFDMAPPVLPPGAVA